MRIPSSQRRLPLFTLSFRVCAALLLAFAGVECAIPTSNDPDLILTGGSIYPLGSSDNPVAAIAIRGDRIMALGSNEDIQSLVGENTQQMELHGNCVLPGFFDAWMDPEALGRWSGEDLNFSRASSLEEVQALIRNAIPQKAPGDWLIGWGWDESRWPEPVMPSHESLDAVSENRPVLLYHRNGQIAWLNGAALQAARLKAASADPPGGRIIRRQDGSPTGILIGSAVQALESVLPVIGEQRRRNWISTGLQRAAAAGFTAVATSPLDDSSMELYAALQAEGSIPIRVRLRMRADSQVPEQLVTPDPEALLRLTAIGVRVDGAFPSRLAALAKPYADGEGDGMLFADRNRLRHAAEVARITGLPLHLQVQGDRALMAALDALGQSAGAGMLLGLDLLPPGGMAPVQATGVPVAIVPLRFANDIYSLRQRLGETRARQAHRWRKMVAAGVPWLIASDAPAYLLRPLESIVVIMRRRDRNGYPTGGWYPDQGLGRSIALRALVGSTAMNDRGVLSPGAPADLVVWSEDLLTSDAEALMRAQALLTMVAGRVVYSRALIALPMDSMQGQDR